MSSFTWLLTPDPIDTTATLFAHNEGAEVQFLGTVRGEEEGRPISGLKYSAYLPMAERLLADLCEEGQRTQEKHRVHIHHRLDFVSACEPSLLIKVQTRHSAAAFEICQWYLREIKTKVPIWKEIVSS